MTPYQRLDTLFEECLARADVIARDGNAGSEETLLGEPLATDIRTLGSLAHAARGVALTLCAYKAVDATQDVTRHMSDYPGGFPARRFDEEVTIPFLQRNSLPRSVQSHWLTRRLVERPISSGLTIKTAPRAAGRLLVSAVDAINRSAAAEARAAVILLLVELVSERNRSRVLLTRPKQLTVTQVGVLLRMHLGRSYARNAPRLPQVALHALYGALMSTAERYRACDLDPLLPMKAADRKAGTVGDVIIRRDSTPFEGVETKLGIPVTVTHVLDAIDKLRAATVERYFILSTAGVEQTQREDIATHIAAFRASNGCEIIVNGVFETIEYYLRILDSPFAFVNLYAAEVESDIDLGYEHRAAWNEFCAGISV